MDEEHHRIGLLSPFLLTWTTSTLQQPHVRQPSLPAQSCVTAPPQAELPSRTRAELEEDAEDAWIWRRIAERDIALGMPDALQAGRPLLQSHARVRGVLPCTTSAMPVREAVVRAVEWWLSMCCGSEIVVLAGSMSAFHNSAEVACPATQTWASSRLTSLP
jgi:hypothetical protein